MGQGTSSTDDQGSGGTTTTSLSGGAEEHLLELFQECDRNGDGKVNFEELLEHAEQNHLDVAEMRAVFESLDINGDKAVSYSELLKGYELFAGSRPLSSTGYTDGRTPSVISRFSRAPSLAGKPANRYRSFVSSFDGDERKDAPALWAKVGKYKTAQYPFLGTSPMELSFHNGDTLWIAYRLNGWCFGISLATSEAGVFPENYVIDDSLQKGLSDGRVGNKKKDIGQYFTDKFRHLVSKKKKRFMKDGFDLDLSYITERIIAMGFPAAGGEGMYRNPVEEVIDFLHHYHDDHFKLYNLCSERKYEPSLFDGRVSRYPFDDHNAPPLWLIRLCCEDLNNYLRDDPENTAVLHCKAGKGRTGLMIASFLVHVGFVQPDFESATQHAESALETFAEQRTKNKKGVTIPSQKRYVGYYQRLLEKGTVSVPQCTLKSITMSPMPAWNDIDIVVKISVNQGEDHYDAKSCDGLTDRRCQKVVKWENLQNLKKPLQLRGDVLVTFERTSHFGKNQEFCRMWFNTAFLKASNWKIVLKRDELDKVCRKPKEYSPNFSVTICVQENRAHEPLLMNSWLHTKSTLFDVTSLLRTVPLLSTIEHVDVIACFLKEDVFEKDDPILVKGDSKHTFCLVLSGEAELCGSEDGTVASRKMFKGHSAGERSLVRKQSCDVDVVARGDVTCIRMNYQVLSTFVNHGALLARSNAYMLEMQQKLETKATSLKREQSERKGARDDAQDLIKVVPYDPEQHGAKPAPPAGPRPLGAIMQHMKGSKGVTQHIKQTQRRKKHVAKKASLVTKARAHLAKRSAKREDDEVQEAETKQAETKQGSTKLETSQDAFVLSPPLKVVEPSPHSRAESTDARLRSSLHETYFRSRKSSIGSLRQRMQIVEFARDNVMWNASLSASSSAPLGKGLSVHERQLVQTFNVHDRNFILERIRSRQKIISQGQVGSQALRRRVLDEFVATMSSKK